MPFTCIFEGDVREFPTNPFHADTPFGSPISVGVGDAHAMLNEQADEIERMRSALEAMLNRYVGLVNCGDCGNWDPETEEEVIDARAALK